MQTNQHLLNTRRQEIRMLLDKLAYVRDGHRHHEIHEQLSQAIAEARRVRQILCDTVSPH